MTVPSEYYVDPSIAGDSGAGSSGDPFGDLQYALNNITQDTTSGDRINIKNGTDEVLSASLDFSTYGSPSILFPLILQGYTSTAGDGGQGGINCNSNTCFANSALDAIKMVDLHIHTCTGNMIDLDNDIMLLNCELNNSSGIGVTIDQDGLILSCNIYDCDNVGVYLDSGVISFNYFANGTKDFTSAISFGNGSVNVARNIISIDGSTNGITVAAGSGRFIANNSILSAGGTGIGISGTGDIRTGIIASNLIEGFSGTGGVGLKIATEFDYADFNAVYNCATAYSLTTPFVYAATDNETLSASPFAKSGADTFANRATYFAPVDTGNVIGGAYQ